MHAKEIHNMHYLDTNQLLWQALSCVSFYKETAETHKPQHQQKVDIQSNTDLNLLWGGPPVHEVSIVTNSAKRLLIINPTTLTKIGQ